ncbi:MAG: efflux RND transporter permease subunit, partial [Pseudomonadota bacterium]
TELADRKMAEGLKRKEAYAIASKRMSWPITASTATTLAAFSPLLFWPGVVGEFMKYLPITLVATLGASLFMALIFVPTLGRVFGKRSEGSEVDLRSLAAAESGNLEHLTGLAGGYVRFLRRAIDYPIVVLLFTLSLLAGIFMVYGSMGKGIEFFPDAEAEQALVHIRARGNLSVDEIDQLARAVESKISDIDGIKTLYSRAGIGIREDEAPVDTVGVIQIEFEDWKLRRKASVIMEEIRQKASEVPGIFIEVRKPPDGPEPGKPIQIQLTSEFPALLGPGIELLADSFSDIGGLIDIEDSRPLPGIEWQVKVDRGHAGRFGADVVTVGNAVKLVTNGINISSYRPDDANDDVDIVVRLPKDKRHFDQLDRMRVQTLQGQVPISNFIERKAVPQLTNIHRVEGNQVMTIKADVPEGVLADDKLTEIKNHLLQNIKPDPRLSIEFLGEDKEQKEAEAFLTQAFLVALFLMAIILVTQFNSFYQAFLILTAVIFSTGGVFVGLLITGQPFGIVMCGIGVIALAGIIVNNNIVLIDTFNVLRKQGMELREAILRTGALRLRPVLLTTITTVLGLAPMVFELNIDLINREILSGAPSTQWWVQLATAVAGGLLFATLLTLVLTPCLLMLGERILKRKNPNEPGTSTVATVR